MTLPSEKPMTGAELKALGQRKTSACNCSLKICDGWESVSDERWPVDQLKLEGTLRTPLPEGQMDLSFEEYHPQGTRYDSANAPIAPPYFPYNRCDVYACSNCRCAVLKYTEYGGYYVDHRVRRVAPDLVIDN